MKTDKKQTVQLVILGLLVVVCVGYLSFSLMAPKGTAKHSPTKSTTSTRETTVPDKEPDKEKEPFGGPCALVSPESQSLEANSEVGTFPVRRDPFAPQKLPVSEDSENASTPSRSPTKTNAPKIVASIKNSLSKVPKIDLRPFNPFAGREDTSRTQPLKEEKPEQEENIVLTGIIRGEQNVAIIRIGDTGRHIVKEGQTIDGRYRVASVTGDGAVLVYKNRHIPVRLGGSKNAK